MGKFSFGGAELVTFVAEIIHFS